MPSTGAKLPTAAQTISEAPYSNDTWQNPNNIFGAGEASVTSPTFDAGDYTYVLKAYTFDFSSIPDGSTINGVRVVINSRYANDVASIVLVQLLDISRAKVGDNKAGPTSVTTTATDYTFGGIADTWGNALTTAWVKDADFGVAVAMRAGGTGNNNVDVFIDYVTMEINYATPIVTTDGNNTQATDSVTLTGQLNLLVDNADQTSITEDIIQTNRTTLVVADASQQSHSLFPYELGIQYVIVTADADQTHAADELVIELVTGEKDLSVDSVSHTQLSGSNDITWIYLLDAEGNQVLDEDGYPILVPTDDLFLGVAGAVVVADANQAQAADGLEISGNKYIQVDDTNQANATTDVTFAGGFLDQRQAIILGLNSAQSELHGWNNEVRDTLPESAVVRTSDTVVTITLPPEVAYAITAQETITATIPDSALTGSPGLIGTPSFTVDITEAALISDANQAHTADTVVLASVLEVSDANHTHAADGLELVRRTNLQVDNTNHTQAADALTIPISAAVLSVADANHTQTSDSPSPTLRAAHLDIDAANQSQATDVLNFIIASTLEVQDAIQDHISVFITLNALYSIEVQDADQAQDSSSPFTTAKTSLTVADGDQAQAPTEPAPNTGTNLSVDNADHTQTTDSITLYTLHELVVQDGFEVQVSDGIDLTSITSISVDDVSHTQSYTPIPLVFYVIAEPEDASHDQIVDAISLLIHTSLLVNDANHTQTSTNITDIGTVGVFNAFDGIQAQTADTLTLVLLPRFAVHNALQGQYADNVPLYVDIHTPLITHVPCGHWHVNVTDNPVWAFVAQPEKPHYNEATSISSRTNPVWIFTKQENKL